MNTILLRAKDTKTNVIQQQKHIFRYAHQNELDINFTEIDNSGINDRLETKNELKGFLRSLRDNDNILIHSLSTFSSNTEDLIKIFNCLFERSICVYITNINIKIKKSTKAIEILSVLMKENDIAIDENKTISQGRPKGRMSKSKFDIYRLEIIDYLEKNCSVNEISKLLNVSRSSLKDYINSRGLKDLVETRTQLLQKKDFKKTSATSQRCNITKKDRNNNGLRHK